MYFAIIFAIVAIDQIIKYIARTELIENVRISVLGNFLTIDLHYNTGAAFSFMQGFTMILTIFPAIMIILIIIYITKKRKTESRFLLISLSLIAGGGIGNLIDRAFLGKVTDFVSMGNFPIFNFADMCVVSGCILVGIYLIFIEPKKEKEEDADQRIK